MSVKRWSKHATSALKHLYKNILWNKNIYLQIIHIYKYKYTQAV